MFALGDISRFEGDNSEKVTSCKILKPVWDVITDYLVIFLAMLSIVFAGMEVTSGSFECLAAVNCPGKSSSNTSSFLLSHMKYHNVCKSFYNSQKTNVRIKGTDVLTDLKSSVQYSNFVNSECSKSAIPNFLAYFWFLMFIEAFVLIILDNLWLKLPTTAATIESFVSLVMACYASPCSNLDLTKALSDVPNPKVENSASDDSGSDTDQTHELGILDDTATVSAIRTLYEKLETFKEINATSSDNHKPRVKIWLLYLIQAILETIFALIFFTLNICHINDLKETMKCTVAQHIPVPHDYFICSHSLAPAFRLGVYLYSSVLGLCLLTYIYITGWTGLKVKKNKCEYNFKEENLPPLVGEKLSDMNSVNEDFGFLLHLLHSYSKLYVVRLAHYLSKSNKKKIQAEFLSNKYRISKLRRRLRKNEKKITFNGLRGIPQTIFQLGTEIVTLELKQCELEIEDFDNFYQLTSLRKLSVIDCGLQCIPDGILTMYWLEELNLKVNSVTLIDERVSNLEYLTSLDLSNNDIKTIQAGSLEQLKNLFTVDVTDNSGLGIPELKVILACERLRILRCSKELSDKRNDLNVIEREKFDAVTSAERESFVIPYTPDKAPHIDVQNTQKNYKMDSQPKGVAIIINIMSFRNFCHREGSEKDFVKLKTLFENIGFDTVCNPVDYTAEEAKEFLKECAKERKYESCDCIVVAVMTHGTNGGLIFHNDEVVPVPDIVDCVQMSSLYDGKPKLFFFQCCRGPKKAVGRATFSSVPGETSTDRDSTHSTELHAGVTATDSLPVHSKEGETDASPTPHVMFEADIPNGADVLLSYSTMQGYASFRNVSKGSWFVQALVETFSQHAFEEDVLSLLTLVNYEVARAHASVKWRQVPCPQSTLMKKLYLLPGYPCKAQAD